MVIIAILEFNITGAQAEEQVQRELSEKPLSFESQSACVSIQDS